MDGWQHIPEYINPIAFTVGFFSVHFYALSWLGGFFSALLFTLWQGKKSGGYGTGDDIYNLFIGLFFGALIGGRLGYVLLYQPDIYLRYPLQIFLPYDPVTSMWTGIAGMSFHGGLVGVVIVLFLFTRKRKVSFWKTADVVALALPLALFFGRIGNFLNQELYGRVTTYPWGMYFPDSLPLEVLRHPSALYEAFLEGVVLFVLLFIVGRRIRFPGGLAALFLICYGTIRFFVEYVREPDSGTSVIVSGLSLGQVLSLPMVVVGLSLFVWLQMKNHAKIRKESSLSDD